MSRATSRSRSGLEPGAVEIAVLVAIVILLIAGVVLTSGRSTTTTASSSVHVEPGQTLWTLAEAHPVSGLTTQQTADLIARLNGLTDGSVLEHTTLRVPARPSDGAVACR